MQYSTEREQKGKSIVDILDNYIVVDIETTGLSSYFDEIIELAAIKVENGSIVEEFQTLVKPQYIEDVDEFITELTGITPEMLVDAPALKDVLPEFINFVGTNILIGHNTPFDINFIYDNIFKLFQKPFCNDFIDTMRISRKLFPTERRHRLVDLVERFNISTSASHRALPDAIATHGCYEHLKQHVVNNNIDIKELFKKYQLHAKDITTDKQEFNEDTPVFGKTFVFTGVLEKMQRKDAMQLVIDMGGICEDRITKKTNFLVLGNNDYCATIKDGKSTKHKKAESYKLKGQEIEIIPEVVFYDLISDN